MADNDRIIAWRRYRVCFLRGRAHKGADGAKHNVSGLCPNDYLSEFQPLQTLAITEKSTITILGYSMRHRRGGTESPSSVVKALSIIYFYGVAQRMQDV